MHKNDNIKVKQGEPINLYESELEFIENLIREKNISKDYLDFNQRILSLPDCFIGYIKTPMRTIEISYKDSKISLDHFIRMYYFVYENYEFDDEVLDPGESKNFIKIKDLYIKELNNVIKKGLPKEFNRVNFNSKFATGNIDYIKSYYNRLNPSRL